MPRVFHLPHIGRIHDVVSILRTEEQVAPCQMPHSHPAEITLTQFVLTIEYHQLQFAILQALEPAKTIWRCNPYIAISVFYHSINHLVRHSLHFSEEARGLILGIDDEKPVERTYPYPALTVDEQCLARSVELHLRSLIIYQILWEKGTSGSWRIHEQALSGCHPDAMPAILLKVVDHLIFLQRLVFQRHDSPVLFIKASDASMIIHPDAMLAVFQKSTYDVVVNVSGRNATLHEVMNGPVLPQEQSLAETSCPDSSLAIHHASDNIGTTHRDRRSLMIQGIQGKQAFIRR